MGTIWRSNPSLRSFPMGHREYARVGFGNLNFSDTTEAKCGCSTFTVRASQSAGDGPCALLQRGSKGSFRFDVLFAVNRNQNGFSNFHRGGGIGDVPLFGQMALSIRPSGCGQEADKEHEGSHRFTSSFTSTESNYRAAGRSLPRAHGERQRILAGCAGIRTRALVVSRDAQGTNFKLRRKKCNIAQD